MFWSEREPYNFHRLSQQHSPYHKIHQLTLSHKCSFQFSIYSLFRYFFVTLLVFQFKLVVTTIFYHIFFSNMSSFIYYVDIDMYTEAIHATEYLNLRCIGSFSNVCNHSPSPGLCGFILLFQAALRFVKHCGKKNQTLAGHMIEYSVHGARSVIHDLEPNTFPSGPR